MNVWTYKKPLTIILLVLCFICTASAQDIEKIKAPELVRKYEAGGGVLVINFWSTWCKPCIDEIPHFIEVSEQLKSKGVSLWLISQDTKELFYSGKLKTYINGKKGWIKAKLFWFDETDADYYCPIIDKGWSGVIPATLIIHPQKGYRKFIEESMDAKQLIREIEKAF